MGDQITEGKAGGGKNEGEKNVHRVLVVIPEGKKTLGRPRRR